MPKILDLYVMEETLDGRWGSCSLFKQPNPRLVTAIVRRFIEKAIRHPTFKRVNVILSPNSAPSPRVEVAPLSPKWSDVWIGASPENLNSMPVKEHERALAEIIFEAALAIFPATSQEASRIREVRAEFESYYDKQITDFLCRKKETKTYRVILWYTINWSLVRPFWVAYLDYEDLKPEGKRRRVSFTVRGTEDALFGLAGKISVKAGEILLTPRPTAVKELKRLRYEVPMRFAIDDMPELAADESLFARSNLE